MANSLALEQAKITEDTPDPKGGVIRRYPETTKPNGVFEENALFLVMNRIPPSSLAQGLAAITAAAQEYASKGVTTAQRGDRHCDIFLGRERAYRISPAKSTIDRGLRFRSC